MKIYVTLNSVSCVVCSRRQGPCMHSIKGGLGRVATHEVLYYMLCKSCVTLSCPSSVGVKQSVKGNFHSRMLTRHARTIYVTCML